MNKILLEEATGYKDAYPREITGEVLSVKRHFEVILERMSEGVLEITSQGRIIYANRVAISLIDVEGRKLLGAHLAEVFSKDDNKRISDLLKEMPDTPKGITENSPLHLNGHQLTLNILPVNNKNGFTAIIILNDIGEQKRMEAILHQAQKMEAIGTLAGGIAHNFNNLLMGIQGNISLMLMEMDPSHMHYNKLKMMEKCAQSGADLTSQLLGLAKGRNHEVIPTNLNELIKESARMFDSTKKEITIHSTLQKNIWVAEVDPGQIEQIMLNLYVNAWQAMPASGKLYLETKNVTLNEQYVKPYGLERGRYVKISVTDTGSGMDKKTLRKIFDPFFTTKEMGKGTGLGLASAYKIIKNHCGIINVYSEKGEGTTFNVFLPASEKKLTEECKSFGELLMGNETILLVDDEEWVIDVGKEIIDKMGYRVYIARSGSEAIEVYKEHWTEIDMVILDMIMPDMGGGETFEKLKEINPEIEVLLSSGYGINGQASKILEHGCRGFIQKPFFIEELSRKLREILEKNRP